MGLPAEHFESLPRATWRGVSVSGVIRPCCPYFRGRPINPAQAEQLARAMQTDPLEVDRLVYEWCESRSIVEIFEVVLCWRNGDDPAMTRVHFLLTGRIPHADEEKEPEAAYFGA